MLANSFKTAEQLKLDSRVYQGLQKVLTRLETNDLVYVQWGSDNYTTPNGFNMNVLLQQTSCGTAGCIAGWTAIESGLEVEMVETIEELQGLFYPPSGNYNKITVAQTAQTLRHYLTTGEIDWSHIKND